MSEENPKMTRAMSVVRWLILAVSVAVAGFSWWAYVREEAAGDHGHARGQPRYHCPMHPSIVSDQPGTCPICNMRLEPIPEPSPIAHAHGQEGGVPNLAPVNVTLARAQEIGLRTTVAELKKTPRSARVSARVEAPEQGLAEVHVRAPGFVESILVRETGRLVQKGETLLSLYSPEAFQAQAELVAVRALEGADATRIANAAKTKLALLGVPSSTVEQVQRTGTPVRAFPVVAPARGYVTKKSVVLGSYVTPETVLYELLDLSRVYVVADVFARDADLAKVGADASFELGAAAPKLEGKLDLVYPSANAEARTVRVRMQVPNEARRLVPGQVGTLELRGPEGEARPVVPRDAVVTTGEHTYVFVVVAVDAGAASGETEMAIAPREVVLAPSAGEEITIEQGLAAGERVVAGATFLVDSESRLRAALQEVAP